MEILDYPFDNAEILQKRKKIKKQLIENDNLIDKKVAILSGSTIGEIKYVLELFLLNQGIKPEFWEGQYNRFYEDIIFDNDGLKDFSPDIIYIHTTNKNIDVMPEITDDADTVENKLNSIYSKFYGIWDKIKNEYHCSIIQNNFEMPAYRLMGNAEVYNTNGKLNFINRLNEKLYNYARSTSGFYINDINYLSAWYGLEKWSEISYWYLYKYALNIDAIPVLCNSISNIIKSILGKNKKSIVLDLDNTLWGGVIGDDGVENIKLGYETPIGMAYYDFQKYIKGLSQIGISLNICSKNEENIAASGFEHSSSILCKDDFICFKANWNNKDINISNIAKELNISTDSIVFIDDNPVERELVKNNIPDISVPNITVPERYIDFIDKNGFFEITAFSEDDKNRNNFYKFNKERLDTINNFIDYNEYLVSLEMKCEIGNFNNKNIQRITQLINKTNQFNLTTKRYTEVDIEKISVSSQYLSVYGKLVDKYGDNGIVTCIIGKIEKNILNIDLWVMSCRVFKRNLEFTMFDELVKICKQKDISIIRGNYIKTKKNELVKEFYKSIGFEWIEGNDEYSIWQYNIDVTIKKYNTIMEVYYDK